MKDSDLTKSEIIELYRHIGEKEQHFNEIESRYRFLASNWLLAMFGAVGFLTFEAIGSSNYYLIATAGVAAFIAQVGVALIWNLDLMVYHALLDTVFVEGIKLEKKYDWLPKIRLKMFPRVLHQTVNHSTVRVFSRIRAFYLATISVCGLTSVVLLLIFGMFSKWSLAIPLITFVFVVSSGIVIYVYKMSRSKFVSEWVTEMLQEQQQGGSN